MYRGAIHVLEDLRNPERFVHAAQSFREIIEKLPAYFDAVPQKANQQKLGDGVRNLEEAWSRAHGSEARNEGAWSGSIDKRLRRFLRKVEKFFAWYAEHHPRRRAEIGAALQAIEGSGLPPLPAKLADLQVSYWMEIKDFFTFVAHHRRSTNDEEFDQWKGALERLLLIYLAPPAVEEIQTIESILEEGEKNG